MTLLYQIFRACERYGIDPARWDERDPAMKRALLLQERTRLAEEAAELMPAGVGGGGAL